tara:strand:+ start:161 stop:1111 length:951 start_codon:yes stop_codon:yes gene_type:complete
MNILSIVNGFVPGHNNGATWVLHDVLKYLSNKGHTCTVSTLDKPGKVVKGIEVTEGLTMEMCRKADVIFTHLRQTGLALNMGRALKKPVVFFSHGRKAYGVVKVRKKGVFVIYNANHTKELLEKEYKNQEGMVLHPPIHKDYYQVKKRRTYITIINHCIEKGGDIFSRIAEAMPDRKFLAVKGSYGDQYKWMPKNVRVEKQAEDIRKVYKRTSILLMPSISETYGRTALEAMCSGIPVITSDNPGISEACGYIANYVINRTNVDEWVKAIEEVEEDYQTTSKNCKLFTDTLNPERDLAEFENFLTNKVLTWKPTHH